MATQLQVKGILFDMDGTLVNTIECVEKWWRILAKQYGVDADKLLHNVHGHPTIDVMNKWFPPSMQNSETVDKLEYDVMMDTEGVFAVPGARQILEQLSPDQWSVVTAATALLAKTRLEQTGLPQPKHMISSRDVSQGKPHPECYEAGAKFLGLKPTDTVVFEDSVNGTKAGMAAGAIVIGLLTSSSEQDLRQAGAQYIIKDFNDIQVDNSEKGSIQITIKGK